jgi:hypothetical protein
MPLLQRMKPSSGLITYRAFLAIQSLSSFAVWLLGHVWAFLYIGWWTVLLAPLTFFIGRFVWGLLTAMAFGWLHGPMVDPRDFDRHFGKFRSENIVFVSFLIIMALAVLIMLLKKFSQ